MILVLLTIFLAAMVVSIVEEYRSDTCTWFVLSILSGIAFAVALIATIFLTIDVSEGKVIPEKIVMYEEENQKIEESIDLTVQNYLGYETEVYEKMRGDGGSVAIVTAYPELASSTLVDKQIETYTSNNDKIKELKEGLIELPVLRWWLYFGS